MIVRSVKHIDDCFDGSSIKELLLSEEITEPLIRLLSENGTMQYFPDFARPFFKIRVEGLYEAKGIVGNTTLRIHLKAPREFTIEAFSALMERYAEYVRNEFRGPPIVDS